MSKYKKALIFIGATLWFIWAIILTWLVYFSEIIQYLNNL